MEAAIVLSAVALLAALFGSVWLRRAEWDSNGETGALLLGLVFSLIAVILIVLAVVGFLSS